MYINIYIYNMYNICRSETLGKDRCTASTDNGKDRYIIIYSMHALKSVKIVVQYRTENGECKRP